ncbi:TetR/AcrR family transcriptional regulator [Shewanella litoralis]|uniref:TetR family transcriptional regulator n=1 Tax=Shewanella litoralis TaxID=2282700 RepID=A0ABQ2R208_9GAMM|nr:TetR/AcrR family transcriptional regulator [Shewanella litoralis]GGQ04802.1 TetR family transcriptional regulator [Shewanella litoralis]
MKAGRKRAFDKNEVIDKAMRLFWQNGYSGTSVAMLSAELGLNTSSLYATFGSKEQLFKDALHHYIEQYVEPNYAQLQPTSTASLKTQLQACFHGLITLFTNDETPKGCLLVKSVNESDSVAFPQEALTFIRESGIKNVTRLVTLMGAKIDNADLPEGQTAQTLAKYLLSVSYGLAVQAKSGHPASALYPVFDYALLSIPESK